MANIKNITKKLVDAGYSEEKLILMTEKDIRTAYKNYKSSPKEDDSILSSPNIIPENNDNTMDKEEITMTNEMIKEMKKLARKYDAFTHYIDDCGQREEAEKHNKILAVKFVEVANKMGINATVNDLYEIISNDSDSFDESIEIYIKSHEIKVLSTTLTQENGELTFVELSPEQKLEISKVLDSQLKDVNYSSWFEEENGIFKLYTAWVDEDPTVEEEYYFDDNNKLVEVKEETTMKNNTNNTVTNNSATVEKEEFTMKELVKRITENKKVHDKGYIDRPTLKTIMNEQFGFNFSNRSTRTEMVEALMNKYKDSLKVADENTVEDSNITHDNASEPIEESPATVELNDELATKILKKVIYQANTNRAHNFISDWMLTSIISELIIGLPLKDKGVEHYKTFTAEQKKNLAEIRKAFIMKAKLIAKYNNSKITGYYIPAKILVWGRHIYLGVACVYRFMSGNKVAAEYHVSLNGIKNIATGNIAELDDAAYETLDTKCVFVM